MTIQAQTATARSKAEAARMIEAQAASVVDLDYEDGGKDVIELQAARP